MGKRNTSDSSSVIYRAAILHFLSDPDLYGDEAYQYLEDGALFVQEGRVVQIAEASELLSKLPPEIPVIDYRNYLIIPGLIDLHIHFPQTAVIASYGKQLLDWLEHHTYPAEQRFEDDAYASEMADFFLDELMRNGTTTACVFGSVHKSSVDAFFNASEKRNTRMICGKVMMDRNAPDYLCDTAASSYEDSRDLIEQWHNKGRQSYAVTPRFAITSSEEQLDVAARLVREYPDVFVQTHLSENQQEIAQVKALFPNRQDYLDVYEYYHLLGARSVFAHGIHLSGRELERLHQTKSRVAFCPTSNLFLGSGLLDVQRLEEANVHYGIASDVGAGTSFSMLRTLSEGYKVAQLQGRSVSALKSLYLGTLGNATCLGLDNKIGSFRSGNEADFVVLDLNATPLMALKQSYCKGLSDKLFALMMLGDDRAVKSTYIMGVCQYNRDDET